MFSISQIIHFIFVSAARFTKISARNLFWGGVYLTTSAFLTVNSISLIYFAFIVGTFLYKAWTIISSFLSVINLIISGLLFLDRYRLKLKEESRSHESIYFTNPNNSIYELIKIDDEPEIMTV